MSSTKILLKGTIQYINLRTLTLRFLGLRVEIESDSQTRDTSQGSKDLGRFESETAGSMDIFCAGTIRQALGRDR